MTNATRIDVLQTVLKELTDSRHVKPVVYTDVELSFVEDDEAPGIELYRQQLRRLLAGHEAKTLRDEEIIAKLDQAGKMFCVLIIKTNPTLPHISVFRELDCAYCKAELEAGSVHAFCMINNPFDSASHPDREETMQ